MKPLASDCNFGSVGIVGIGAMGWPIALNLQRRGHSPQVRDIDPQATGVAAAHGLEVRDSAAALADACDTLARIFHATS